MKIRTGFVSNSSSSSFICDVCGHEISGWDMCLSEAEMVECINGHTFCDEHVDKNSLDGNIGEEIERYDYPAKYCPFCKMEQVTKDEMLRYCLYKLNKNRTTLADQIREEFNSDYNTFVTTLKEW